MIRQFTRIFALAMVVMASLGTGIVAAQGTNTVVAPNVDAAIAWLIDQQQPDGSWLGFSGEPDAGTTIDAIIALAAAREADLQVGDAVEHGIAYLGAEGVAAAYVEGGPGAAAKLLMALVAADTDGFDIAGVHPLEMIDNGQDAATGMYGSGLYDHAYVLIALAATDSEIPANAIDFLATVQAENGGFAWDGSTDEANVDSNTTAMIVQALVATGHGDSEVVTSAIGFLKSTITTGGAASGPGQEADANSTALVAQALLAVGDDASGLISDLGSFQNEDGALFWMSSDTSDNAFSTGQAIPAMVGATLPVIPGMFELDAAA